jgi:predicted nucleic acid-binding protein
MSSPAFACDYIILDACCIINLCASDHLDEILRGIPTQVAVAEYVKENEVLTIRYSDSGHDRRIELQAQIDRGLISVISLESETEEILYVNYASAIGDDGESMTSAIAVNRGWGIATDDRRAISFFQKVAPQLPVATTPDLLKNWADTFKPSVDDLRLTLQKIRNNAMYEPPKSHPLREWWEEHTI